MRTEHCAFALCNPYGRCIAECWRNLETVFEEDCTGVKRDKEPEYIEAGREVLIAGGRN